MGCISLFSIQGVSMEISSNVFTQESFLLSSQKSEIESFWLDGHFNTFQGTDDIRINYASFIKPQHIRNLVVVPGRNEGYLKYKELAFDLVKQGFNVFIIDHRGQGISERLLKDSHKGYVKSFEHYAEDLNSFIVNVVNKSPTHLTLSMKPYLLAHSMGGAISLRLMQKTPNLIQAAILSAPMIDINLGGLPRWFAQAVVNSGNAVNKWWSNEPWYFMKQGGYKSVPFKENKLTHSHVRYQRFIEEYQNNKCIQLGGVTFNWLSEAFNARENILKEVDRLSTPLLILQASKETIVDNEAQNLLCDDINIHKKTTCEKIIITGAKHEIFFEKDIYRNPALQKVLTWINKHPPITLP